MKILKRAKAVNELTDGKDDVCGGCGATGTSLNSPKSSSSSCSAMSSEGCSFAERIGSSEGGTVFDSKFAQSVSLFSSIAAEAVVGGV